MADIPIGAILTIQDRDGRRHQAVYVDQLLLLKSESVCEFSPEKRAVVLTSLGEFLARCADGTTYAAEPLPGGSHHFHAAPGVYGA